MSTHLPSPAPIQLTVLPSHDCNYLPGRVATARAFRVERMPGGMYERFMDAGFRRSGKVVYQPICKGCRECVPIRVAVDRFKPNKSQRRCIKRNADLVTSSAEAELTEEKLDLYQRYQAYWHGQSGSTAENVDRESVKAFLYESPVHTLEFSYRNTAGKLLGVGIVDVSDRALSSVYFYFDPAEYQRGLGTFGAVYELQWALQMGIEFYYLGYYIRDCNKMNYKSRFRPAELLGEDGHWHSFD